MPTYTVTRTDDSPWEVARDGVVIETARANWDADQVLEIAEAHAGQPMAWKLIDGGGFESLGSLEILRRLGEEYQHLADRWADLRARVEKIRFLARKADGARVVLGYMDDAERAER